MTIAPEAFAPKIEDLYHVDGKAELVRGKIRFMSPTGFLPGNAGGLIYASLLAHARRTKAGRALPRNVGFAVDLPNRKSFIPDAAFYSGPRSGMRFLQGAPVFAVEVRSEGDYDTAAAVERERKPADYFAAGTLVVWDVDLLGNEVVRKFIAGAGTAQPVAVFTRNDVADAEPAVPNWSMPVDELFDEDQEEGKKCAGICSRRFSKLEREKEITQ